MNISVQGAPWCLHKLWTHGHVGVVRSLLWDAEVNSNLLCFPIADTPVSLQNRTLVTGGEDSKINLWPIHPVELAADEDIDIDDADEDESMDVDDMPLPQGHKRERSGEKELVCLSNALLDS